MLRSFIAAMTALTALTLATNHAAAQSCPGFSAEPRSSHALDHDEIDESSGLAASRSHPDVFWTHNDSGADATIYALDDEGAHLGTVGFEQANFIDIEDIAVAPCERGSSDHCIYLGDIGDNRSKRPQVIVYKFPEPELPDERPFDIQSTGVEKIILQYDGGPRDAEALMVHPDTLELLIVEKTPTGRAGVFKAMADTRGQPTVQVAARVEDVEIPSIIVLGRLITGGDISPDGRRLSLRTYLAVFTWCIGDDESVVDALSREPTVSSTPGMVQSEALAYDSDGTSIWLTSERRPTPMIRLVLEKTDANGDTNE